MSQLAPLFSSIIILTASFKTEAKYFQTYKLPGCCRFLAFRIHLTNYLTDIGCYSAVKNSKKYIQQPVDLVVALNDEVFSINSLKNLFITYYLAPTL